MQRLTKTFEKRVHKTESPMERMVVDEILKYKDIDFRTQYSVGKYRLDIAWPKYKVALEIDGQEWHRNEGQKARDRLRDEILTNQGWIVERVPGWLVYRSVEIAALKALRHLPGIETQPRYAMAKSKTTSWFVADSLNTGYKEEALRLIRESTS